MSTAQPRAVFSIVFAMVFAIVYVLAVEKNLALFTYHPATYDFGFGVQPPADGPAMYWFGWLATSAIAATLAGTLAALLPRALSSRLWPGLAWAVPCAALVAISVLLRDYFLR
jgi:hypothetical protein